MDFQFCNIVWVPFVLCGWCLGFCENHFVMVMYFNDDVFVNASHYNANVEFLFEVFVAILLLFVQPALSVWVLNSLANADWKPFGEIFLL